jgi:hypothetical protein
MPKRTNNIRRRNVSSGVSRAVKPPTLRPNIQTKHKFRFYSDTSASSTITNRNLLTAAGCIVTTNNSTATSVWMSVKIISVEVWSIPATGTSTCSVEWKGDTDYAGVSQQQVTDTSLSPTFPAHLISRPPSGTLSSFWHEGGSDTDLFTVSVDGSGIVDVTLQLILRDAPSSATATLSIASGTLGTMIYSPLDGSGDKFTPAGLTTTT